VIKAPDNIGPAGPVPKPCDEECDHYVAKPSQGFAIWATKWKEDIITEPGG